jgi:hypothetical protein
MRYMVTNCGRRGVAMGDSSDELTDDPAASFVPTGGVIHLSRSQYVLYRYICREPPARAHYPMFGRVGAGLSQGAE